MPARNGQIMNAVPTRGRRRAWVGFAMMDSRRHERQDLVTVAVVRRAIYPGAEFWLGRTTRATVRPPRPSKEISWTRTSKG
jgi:hypothetical protein